MILSSLLFTFVMGVFVYLSQPQRRVNQSFLILTGIVTAGWQASLWFASTSDNVAHAAFWIKQASAISALIPPSMNLLRLSILHPSTPLLSLFGKGRYWFLNWAWIFMLCQTPFFLKSAVLPEKSRMLAKPLYGGGFLVFSIYFLLALGLLFFAMVKNTRRAEGVKRVELEYLLLSCGASLCIGIFFLIVPNLTGLIDLGAFLPLSVAVFTAITGYGIATRGILDVSVVARRIIAYAILSIYLVLIYVLVYKLATHVLIWLNRDPALIAPFFASCAIVLSVSPVQGQVQRLANLLFINTPPLDVGKTLRDAGRGLNSMMTTDELCLKFAEIMHANLETTQLSILLRSGDDFVQIHPVNMALSIPLASPVPMELEKDPKLFVSELLAREKNTSRAVGLHKEMKTLNVAAAIGLHRQGKLTGLLLLGQRTSGRIYGHDEASAVEGLRDIFGVAYENARLYTELRNSRIYMDLMLNNLVNGVIATNTDGLITTCNKEAARLLNIDPEVLQGQHIEQLPTPLHAILREVLKTKKIMRDRELEIPGSKASLCYLNAGATLFRDHEGQVVGGLLVLQDRTAIRELEEQVKRSERLASLGTLSAGMAHEIKNPLVTLKTFSQLLPERFEDPDFRETFSTLAGKEIGRIDTLVNQLLSFARPAKPKLEQVHLHDLLNSHVKWFRQQAEDSDVLIEEFYSAEQDLILADEDQLRQVFLNLLLNAQEVMPDGGAITLRTRRSGIYIHVSVADDGTGIPPEDLDHVFDPFFTTKSSGTGLGLAVAHQILIEHKADVRVTSQLGRGSRFDLYFPLHQPEASS